MLRPVQTSSDLRPPSSRTKGDDGPGGGVQIARLRPGEDGGGRPSVYCTQRKTRTRRFLVFCLLYMDDSSVFAFSVLFFFFAREKL